MQRTAARPGFNGRRILIFIQMLAVLAGFTPSVFADGDAAAKTKAVFLFNFTKFIEWPIPANDTLHICIIGSEQIVDLLSELASRDSKGHMLQIWSGGEQLQICHILYIDRKEPNLSKFLLDVRGNPVLTVSDSENFARNGGGIGFYAENGQIKLEINMAEVRNAQLKINALLMEVARIVIPGKP